MSVQAVIVAGGLGTRLTSSNILIPKILLNLDGETLLERQIEQFLQVGVRKFLLLLGHQANIVIAEIPLLKKKWGVEIEYCVEDLAKGTGGALVGAHHLLESTFYLSYGDLLLDFKASRLLSDAKNTNGGSILVRPTDHIYDSNLLETSMVGQIQKILIKPHSRSSTFRNRAICGVYYLKRETIISLKEKFKEQKFDFDSEGIPWLIEAGFTINASDLVGYVKDVGTLERLDIVKNGWTTRIRTNKPSKIIFLDRDGVINYNRKSITSLRNFSVIDGFVESIQIFRELEYRIFVVTNQPNIAKGLMTWENLEEIHAYVDTLLSDKNLYIDRWMVCPHYPISGYADEVRELKIECGCRKPEIELFKQIANDFEIDYQNSWLVGDQESDAKAAYAFNIAYVNISSHPVVKDRDLAFNSLLDFAKFLRNSLE